MHIILIALLCTFIITGRARGELEILHFYQGTNKLTSGFPFFNSPIPNIWGIPSVESVFSK